MVMRPSVARLLSASRTGDRLIPSWFERSASVRRDSLSRRPSNMYCLILLYASVVRSEGIFNFFILSSGVPVGPAVSPTVNIHPTCACQISNSTMASKPRPMPQNDAPSRADYLLRRLLHRLRIRSSLPTAAPQCTAGGGSGELAVVVFNLAVHNRIVHAGRNQVRLGVRGVVDDRRGIEDDDVREFADRQSSAILKMLALCRERRHLADRGFERHEMFVAHVVTEEARHRAPGTGMSVRFV